ncbi:hypothetical protein RclHR1_00060019 [Rhizophagus clarus]|uniref:F-box domain-containing protein n=1 Tax=Rhizophagus clarus TaxID=94130 RepID=A0A2Z6RQ23_9GLOM|nr:hypothetical protein RclHR1_00060019 [Rhizophagus clarus]GES74574.1 hypothetical protein GLOIN_2v1765889 [Rhizophagus clarus]
MTKLNRDILYLILEELQDNKRTLYSSLTVNKTWCEIIIRILWRNPWKYLINGFKEFSFFVVIVSHLSEESKNELKFQGVDLPTASSQTLLFNYISFCRHLNLNAFDKMFNTVKYHYSNSTLSILKNEIYNLFINENTKFTHLYLPQKFYYRFSGAQKCFSEIVFLSCNTNIDYNILDELTKICKSIKELELLINVNNNNFGIARLIDIPKNLVNVRFLANYPNSYRLWANYYDTNNESFHKTLENSLIKRSNTIRNLKLNKQPTVNILSSFNNLISLELDCGCSYEWNEWNSLENLTLPFLQILKARYIPVKYLTSLIENTSGSLIEVKIDYTTHDDIENRKIIQAIYHNCPRLKHLKLVIRNKNFSELEKLLINCQSLISLYILTNDVEFDWNNLFKILTKLSPNNLFKFKFFSSYVSPSLESLEIFLDNWKGGNSLSVKFNNIKHTEEYSDLIEKYKAKGVISKFDR